MYLTIHDKKKSKINSQYDSCFDNYVYVCVCVCVYIYIYIYIYIYKVSYDIVCVLYKLYHTIYRQMLQNEFFGLTFVLLIKYNKLLYLFWT